MLQDGYQGQQSYVQNHDATFSQPDYRSGYGMYLKLYVANKLTHLLCVVHLACRFGLLVVSLVCDF